MLPELGVVAALDVVEAAVVLESELDCDAAVADSQERDPQDACAVGPATLQDVRKPLTTFTFSLRNV